MSAATGDGVADLLQRDRRSAAGAGPASSSASCPTTAADVLAALHRAGEVFVEVHDEHGTRVRARLPEREAGHFAEFTC